MGITLISVGLSWKRINQDSGNLKVLKESSMQNWLNPSPGGSRHWCKQTEREQGNTAVHPWSYYSIYEWYWLQGDL